MHSLPIFLRLAGKPVILIGSGDAADAKRRLLERADARIVDETEDAVVAIVAVDDDAQALAAVERLRARRILINAVDRPALCDFTLPAIVDRDPVLVAIGTGGISAGLAKALRQRLEAVLPARLGPLATALHAARTAIRGRFPEPAARRRAIDAALDPGGPLDVLADVPPDAVPRWIAAPDAGTSSITVRIALRTDDPDGLTLGEARWLGRADQVYHDVNTPPAILRRARADATCIAGPAPDTPPPGVTIILSTTE